MKKINQLTVVAMTGLLGLSAYASVPDDFSTVAIKLTVMVQSANSVSGSTTKFNVTKTKVINKDILTLVAAQFGVLPAKAQLVLTGNGFYGGTFAVLNSDGTVFLANVSTTGLADEYELSISNPNNNIYTGQETSTTETFNITTAGDFFYSNAAGTSFLEVYGPATVKDTFKGSGNEPESFKFSGVEDGMVVGNDAIVTGSVSGKGKNTADF
jgi:hypothetical protein